MDFRKEKVSVAMATYNGEQYIRTQINTILDNLQENDELVISDDGSTDKTINIIKEIDDSRIKLIEGPKKGLKKNFENAIENTTGDYIFLSDQDDIWMKDKVDIVFRTFKENEYTLIQHDAIVINENEDIIFESFAEHRKVKNGIIKNLIKNSYHGCCIAFKRELVDKILPIPDNIYLHDQWIGMIAEVEGKTAFISNKLIKYRRHSNNNSSFKHLPFLKMLKNRIGYFNALVKYVFSKNK